MDKKEKNFFQIAWATQDFEPTLDHDRCQHGRSIVATLNHIPEKLDILRDHVGQGQKGLGRQPPPRRSGRRTRSRCATDVRSDVERSANSPRVREGTSGTKQAVVSPPEIAATRSHRENAPDYLPPPPRELFHPKADDDDKISCLSFGLQPAFDSHKKIMCEGCIKFWDICMVNGWDVETGKRSYKNKCVKPWSLRRYAKHKHEGKRIRMEDFHNIFSR